MKMKKPNNIEIANLLDQIADLLENEDANPFRIRAYREAASAVRTFDQKLADFVIENRFTELKALPKIGDGIAAIIGEYVSTGRSSLLEDLESHVDPVTTLSRVPGIGNELAHRVVDTLKINSLAELETAAHDGRLATVEGFGEGRIKGVRTALAGMLSQSAQAKQQNRVGNTKSKNQALPAVATLLEIDRQYRKQAKKDALHKISPRRFNPDNEAWLPVMHTQQDGWLFTVMFSNTAQAHQLNKTDDWVVIYYERDNQENQNTVVTETQGGLKGKRVVRGRDAESQAYYEAKAR